VERSGGGAVVAVGRHGALLRFRSLVLGQPRHRILADPAASGAAWREAEALVLDGP
jgi:hypothetical protein